MVHANKPKKKRRFSAGIRTLMLLVSLVCGFLGFVIVPAENQRKTVRHLKSIGVEVSLEDSPIDPLPSFVSGNEFEEPDWITRWCHENLPAEYLRQVEEITLKDGHEQSIEVARRLANLQHVGHVRIEGNASPEVMSVLADANCFHRLAFNSGSVVSAEVLAQVGRKRNLTSLCIFDVSLEIQGLSHLRKLDKLEVLFLGCPSVDDESLGFLSGLKSLNWLEVESPNIEGHGLRHLAGLESMDRLVLSGLPVADLDAQFLASMPRLESLHLDQSRVTDVTLEYLNRATSLRSLDLGDTRVDGSGLSHLKNCKMLYSLRLSGSRLKFTDGLSDLHGLEYLAASGTEIDDDDVATISLPKLRHIRITETGVTAEGLRKLASNNPRLKFVAARGISIPQEKSQRLASDFPEVEFDIHQGPSVLLHE